MSNNDIDWAGARSSAEEDARKSLRQAQGNLLLNLEDILNNQTLRRSDGQALMTGYAELSALPLSEQLNVLQNRTSPPQTSASQRGISAGTSEQDVDRIKDHNTNLLRYVGNLLSYCGVDYPKDSLTVDNLGNYVQQARTSVERIKAESRVITPEQSAPPGSVSKADEIRDLEAILKPVEASADTLKNAARATKRKAEADHRTNMEAVYVDLRRHVDQLKR